MKKAFTLLELLIVILVLGILTVIVLPRFQKSIKQSKFVEAYITLDTIRKTQEVYYLERSEYSDDISNLTLDFLDQNARSFLYSTDTNTPAGIPNNAYCVTAHPNANKPGMSGIAEHPHIHADGKVGLWISATEAHTHNGQSHSHDMTPGNLY